MNDDQIVMKIVGAGANLFSQVGCRSDEKNVIKKPIVVLPSDIGLSGERISCITSGSYHTVIIYSNGKAYATGYDKDSRIGSEFHTTYEKPTEISIDGEEFLSAAAGGTFTLYLTRQGEVILCAAKGKKIRPEINERISKVFSSYSYCGMTDICGCFYIFDKKNIAKAPRKYKLDKPICELALCQSFLMALSTDGTIFISEDFNTFKALQHFAPSQVKHISGYNDHVLALTANGEVFAYGSNNNGQLGLGDTVDRYDTFQQITTLEGKNVTEVSTGFYHSLFLTKEGIVFSCGSNCYGQLLQRNFEEPNLIPEDIQLNGEVKFIEAGSFTSHLVVVDFVKKTQKTQKQYHNYVTKKKLPVSINHVKPVLLLVFVVLLFAIIFISSNKKNPGKHSSWA